MGQSESGTDATKPIFNTLQRYTAESKNDSMSQFLPFRSGEVELLETLFERLSKKSNILVLSQHVLYARFMALFLEELQIQHQTTIRFDHFLYLLEVFHLNTSVEKKGHYLFRVYDDNQDKRIDEKDLTQIFKLIYPEDLFEGHHSRLARKAMDRFEDKIGDKNQLSLEDFLTIVPADEIKEVMSFRFDQSFA